MFTNLAIIVRWQNKQQRRVSANWDFLNTLTNNSVTRSS